MYRIVPEKKVKIKYDYVFKDFASFYKVANLISVPIFGRYTIGIMTDDVQGLKDFIRVEQNYAAMMIYIHMSKTVVDNISMEMLNLPIDKEVKPYEVFKDTIKRYSLFFTKKSLALFYASIGHTEEDIEDAVRLLANSVEPNETITEKKLSELFILNNMTYPRTVLVSYLYMERWRDKKLSRCLQCVGNDVVLGACIKNIKKIHEDKVKYFRTGQGSNFTKSLSTQRVNMMYKTLVIDRGRIKDLTLLLAMYERSLENDSLQD